jgi:cytoskeletal protein CcmA (bactofilin family)
MKIATRRGFGPSNQAQAEWPEGPHMKFATLAVFAFIGFVAWAGTPVSFAGDGRNLSTVNGEVKASAGETYGSLSTVNGSVHVGNGVTADSAKTVNGEIEVENNAKVGELRTVNGSVEIGEDVVIARTATTVNGEIEIGKRSRVGSDVTTVNGEVEIRGGEVGGKVITTKGDIELTDGARVQGGIHVKKNMGTDWGWGKDKDHPSKVRICSTCAVEGDLVFDRPVELYVEDGARIGKVIGDQVTRR